MQDTEVTMRRIGVLFYSFVLLANAHYDAATEFKAYILELLEISIIDDEHLKYLAENLEKDQIVNPLNCNIHPCNSLQLLHSDALELHLQGDIDRVDFEKWLTKLLIKHKSDSHNREETKKQTKTLWKFIPQRLSLGKNFACAVNSERKAVCWNGRDKCFSNSTLNAPILPTMPESVDQITSGDSHACWLEKNGEHRCAGCDPKMEFLHKQQNTIVQISTKFSTHCTLNEEGSVRCRNNKGQIVKATPTDLGVVTYLSLGLLHSCAILEDGKARCWENNRKTPKSVPSDLGSLTQISVGGIHTCALQASGSVRCWGGNKFGQSNVPKDLGFVTQISTALTHSCALEKSGSAKCWGHIPEFLNSWLSAGEPYLQLSTSDERLCVLNRVGKVQCVNLIPEEALLQLTPPEDLEVLVDDLVPSPSLRGT